MLPNQALAEAEKTFGGMKLSRSMYDAFMLDTAKTYHTSHIVGLIGREDFATAEMNLKNPDVYKHIDSPQQFMNQIKQKTIQRESAERAVIGNNVNNAVFLANQNGGTESFNAPILQAKIDDSMGLAATQNDMMHLEKLSEFVAVQDGYFSITRAMPGMPASDIASQIKDWESLTYPEGEEHAEMRSGARDNAVKHARYHLNGKTTDGAPAYMYQHNADFKNATNEFAKDPTPESYRVYKEISKKTQEALGVSNPNNDILFDTNSEYFAGLKIALDLDGGSTKSETMGALKRVTDVFGEDSMKAAKLLSDEPDIPILIALQQTGNSFVVPSYVDGREILSVLSEPDYSVMKDTAEDSFANWTATSGFSRDSMQGIYGKKASLFTEAARTIA